MPVTRRLLQQSTTIPLEKRGYDVREAAEYLGVSVYQVRQWTKIGQLHPALIGVGNNPKHLFDRKELDVLLDRIFGQAA